MIPEWLRLCKLFHGFIVWALNVWVLVRFTGFSSARFMASVSLVYYSVHLTFFMLMSEDALLSFMSGGDYYVRMLYSHELYSCQGIVSSSRACHITMANLVSLLHRYIVGSSARMNHHLSPTVESHCIRNTTLTLKY